MQNENREADKNDIIYATRNVGQCPDGHFCVIFASCIFSEPRAAHLKHAF